jgi:hypothetical protein
MPKNRCHPDLMKSGVLFWTTTTPPLFERLRTKALVRADMILTFILVIVLNRPSVTSNTTLELFPRRIQQFPYTQDTVRGNNTTTRLTAHFRR